MIGMPRITLINPALKPTSTPMPDTRISAQNSPSTVDNASEPIVTTIVNQTPCIRIGTNSTASLKNFCIGSDQGCVLLRNFASRLSSGSVGLLSPFLENFCDGPALLELGERRIDLGEQLRVALANTDRNCTDRDGLVGIDQTDIGEIALLEIICEDLIVGESRLEAARIHVAQDVGNGVVDLDLAEQSRLLQCVDEGRADLGAY